MKSHYLTHIAALLFFLLATTDAIAQYVWLDEHGVKQFSDVAPPGNIPEKRILKQPHGGMEAANTTPPVAASATATASSSEAPSTRQCPPRRKI